MSTKKVSIQFTSLTSLWNFRLAIQANIFEMNLAQLTITCDCTEAHIALAKEQYRGKIIETSESSDEKSIHKNTSGKAAVEAFNG